MFQASTIKSFSLGFGSRDAMDLVVGISRLGVIVAAARTLDTRTIGLVAAAVALAEILIALTDFWAVRTDNAVSGPHNYDTSGLSRLGPRRRNLMARCLPPLLQVGLAILIVALGADPMIGGILILLSIGYLLGPLGFVGFTRIALTARASQISRVSSVTPSQILAANAMTVVLLCAWPTAYALVLPHMLMFGVSVIAAGYQAHDSLRGCPRFAPPPASEANTIAMFGTRIANALAMYADKLIIGFILGLEVLGLHVVACTLGLGLARLISQVCSAALSIHMRPKTRHLRGMHHALVVGFAAVAPIVVLQSMLAPYYVPILLGPGWDELCGIIAILCLAAIPSVIWNATSRHVPPDRRAQMELTISVIIAVALIINAVFMAPQGLLSVTSGYLAVLIAVQIGAAMPVLTLALLPAHPSWS